jgi:lipopolysaccharide export system protein LptC
MARADNRYSQFVALAKIVLPVLGLGLLSSLFLLSNQSTEVGELPYSEVELEEIVTNKSVLGPNYKTTLESGAAVDLRARTARPILSTPGQFRAMDVTGTMTTASGDEITFDGGVAMIDQNEKIATVQDGLRIVHSDGYILTAKGGFTQFDGTEAMSEGDVVMKGPGITVTAGRAELRPEPGTESQVVVFSGGVRVLYTPQ